MIFTMCAVRDRAIDGFGQPIFVPHVGLAIRSFSDEINRSDSTMNAHPEDYDLYSIGHFDDSNGAVSPTQPAMLISGKQAVSRAPRSE